MKRALLQVSWILSLGAAAVALAGCTGGEKRKYLSIEELQDPETCQDCHPDHYREWSGSMHAYAADDPVFLAMNARGQRATNGALGDFCVKCHAPMAVLAGATTDGTNLDQVPQKLKGVTCYFCHSIESVDGTHNADLTIANDGVMRGGIADPVRNEAHRSRYSPLHDRNDLASAPACGACHDIVTPAGVHLERTFAEWQETVFAQDTPARQTCGHCHMRGRDGVAADAPGVFLRRVHDHAFPGVDVALTPWPEKDAQIAKIQDELDDTVGARLCVNPDGAGGVDAVLRLENVAAGHHWPSGASQDRRGWVELIAYSGTSQIFQTGVVDAQTPIASTESTDPELWLFRDRIYDADGNEVHMFWEAAVVQTNSLGGVVTLDPADPRYYHYQERTFRIFGQVPDRITARVLLRPMGLEVIDDLIASGDLDPGVRDEFPTWVLGNTVLEWDGPPGTCVP